VRTFRLSAALLVVLGLVVATALIMGWSVERAVYLAPVIGGIALLVLLSVLGVELPREGG
jgi:hypothetical protein